MRTFFLILTILSYTGTYGQILRDLNYSYLYNPSEEYVLNWKLIHQGDRIEVFYNLELNQNASAENTYAVQWYMRNDLSEKENSPLLHSGASIFSNDKRSGKLVLDTSMGGKIILAYVIRNQPDKKITLTAFYKILPTQRTYFLQSDSLPVLKTYTQINKPVSIQGFDSGKELLISCYSSEFPSAGPPFAVAQARVPPIIKPDTTFTISESTPISFTKKGLYLVQSDTTSIQGFAFRIEDDYPKLGKLESLTGPMIYVCTKLEYDKLQNAGSDKSQFDKVILGITGNTDRARTFMRNYFRRVEQANIYFSSFKEGWKTDRGMIYIIYGTPQAVYLFEDREVWEYKNTYYNGRFTFVRSSTLFDPDNFVLIRDKKFTNDWYDMIDLWRKARF